MIVQKRSYSLHCWLLESIYIRWWWWWWWWFLGSQQDQGGTFGKDEDDIKAELGVDY